MKTEPVLINQAVTLVVSLLVSFGVVAWGPEVAAENAAVITAAVIAFAEIVQSIITRSQVFSPATVEKMEAAFQVQRPPTRLMPISNVLSPEQAERMKEAE